MLIENKDYCDPDDFLAQDIRNALHYIGEITWEITQIDMPKKISESTYLMVHDQNHFFYLKKIDFWT